MSDEAKREPVSHTMSAETLKSLADEMELTGINSRSNLIDILVTEGLRARQAKRASTEAA